MCRQIACRSVGDIMHFSVKAKGGVCCWVKLERIVTRDWGVLAWAEYRNSDGVSAYHMIVCHCYSILCELEGIGCAWSRKVRKARAKSSQL